MKFQDKYTLLGKQLFRPYLMALIGAALILGLNSCSAITKEMYTRTWSDASVYKTVHYTLNTNTRPATARHIGELMEIAVKEYRELTGYRDDYLPIFNIYAYSVKNEYEAVAGENGFPPGLTTGFYTPEPPAAIHLPYILKNGKHPDATLLHEGVHQFLDLVMSFSVTLDVSTVLPALKHRLLGVPFWLNEGLATYMEGSFVDEDRIEVGSINSRRLLYLQRLISDGAAPSVRDVLSRSYGEPFSARDYAVAWGIVYVLYSTPSEPYKKIERGKLLQQYLKISMQGFYEDPAVEFPRDFLPDGRPLDDIEKQWSVYIASQSPVFFERIIVGHTSNIEEWEQDWIQTISRLKH